MRGKLQKGKIIYHIAGFFPSYCYTWHTKISNRVEAVMGINTFVFKRNNFIICIFIVREKVCFQLFIKFCFNFDNNAGISYFDTHNISGIKSGIKITLKNYSTHRFAGIAALLCYKNTIKLLIAQCIFSNNFSMVKV